jgi:hypothetical protein
MAGLVPAIHALRVPRQEPRPLTGQKRFPGHAQDEVMPHKQSPSGLPVPIKLRIRRMNRIKM